MKKNVCTENDNMRFNAVKTFADNILKFAVDKYGDNPSPLFADGINAVTGEHMQWKVNDRNDVVISNLAHQQNFFRLLEGLSSITGDPKYVNAAKAAIKYHFERLQLPHGLMQWGGHTFVDLKTHGKEGPKEKGMVHELKNNFPFYALMYEVDADATVKYIKAFWTAHVYDWYNLEISRHGRDTMVEEKIWEKEFGDPEPFRETRGLSFLNAGNDLIYSAGILYRLSGDEGALQWSKRLAGMYVKARHPVTGLGVYQFTQPKKIAETDDFSNTLSIYGDRARRQLGPEFGDVALEGNIIMARHASTIYCVNAQVEMALSEFCGEIGKEMLEWVRRGLNSFAKYAYIKETNKFRPLIADGTDLTGFVLKRDGYYGKAGTEICQYDADGKFLYSFSRCARLTGDYDLWKTASMIAEGCGLGNLGSSPGRDVQMNIHTSSTDTGALLAMIDLYNGTGNREYLDMAISIGNNITAAKFINGYFVPTPAQTNVLINTFEPLALLALDAAIKGTPELVKDIVYV